MKLFLNVCDDFHYSVESTPIDPPDVFTDQPTLLSVVTGGTAAAGGSVNPEQMHRSYIVQ